MGDFTNDIPAEFTDDERWLKFFPKKVILVILGCLLITVLVTKILSALFGHFILFISIGFLFTAIVGTLMMIPTSSENAMKGGGQTLMSLILKKRYRRKHKMLYVKGIKDVS